MNLFRLYFTPKAMLLLWFQDLSGNSIFFYHLLLLDHPSSPFFLISLVLQPLQGLDQGLLSSSQLSRGHCNWYTSQTASPRAWSKSYSTTLQVHSTPAPAIPLWFSSLPSHCYLIILSIPNSCSQAITHDCWKQAMQKEFDALQSNHMR